MEKEPGTKFCSLLVRFQEVIKLQSFEFSVSEVIPANVQNIAPLVFFAFFVSFMEKRSPLKFHVVFNHFSRISEVVEF